MTELLGVAQRMGATSLRTYTRHSGSPDKMMAATIRDLMTVAPVAQDLGIVIVLDQSQLAPDQLVDLEYKALIRGNHRLPVDADRLGLLLAHLIANRRTARRIYGPKGFDVAAHSQGMAGGQGTRA